MALPELKLKFMEEVLQDMVNYMIITAPELTDYNKGSRIRTILESSAFEIDEQYHQMAIIAALWNIDNANGRDLDERLVEWNLARFPALRAAGDVIVSNGNLITSFSTQAASVGDTSLFLKSSSGFPTSGFPKTMRIGEGTQSVEDVVFTANNPGAGVVTSAALTKDHAAGARVSLVDGGSQLITAGQRVRVRSTSTTPELTATLIEDATILAGNYDSNTTGATMDSPGSVGNVASGAIDDFVGTSPFDGALVRSSAFTGGRYEESDEQFRARGRAKLQALARGTILSLEQLVRGLEYTGTNGRTWRVISARSREELHQDCNDKVWLYLWPGSFGFIETESVVVPEVLTAAAEDGQRIFKLANTSIVPGTIFMERLPFGAASWVSMSQGTDYFLHEGKGDLEVAQPGLDTGDGLRALRYDHYTGLINKAQIAVNGVKKNPVKYPGINAAGVKTLVTYPRRLVIDPIRISIQVREGFAEADVAPLVANAVSRYLADLQVGDDMIRAELIARGMEVEGMFNLQVDSPTGDIVVLEDVVIDTENVDIIVS